MVNQEVFSPIAGAVKPLSEVSDPAFSEEIMGKGVAIQPSEGRVVSPVQGTVFSLSKSGHAIGLVSDSGAEMLIHIGIDTVKLKGLHFSPEGNRRNPGSRRRSADGIRSGGDREGWLQHHYAGYYYEHPTVSVHPVCWRYLG